MHRLLVGPIFVSVYNLHHLFCSCVYLVFFSSCSFFGKMSRESDGGANDQLARS